MLQLTHTMALTLLFLVSPMTLWATQTTEVEEKVVATTLPPMPPMIPEGQPAVATSQETKVQPDQQKSRVNNRVQFITEDYPPYNFLDEDGQLRGIAIEFLEAMFKEVRSKESIDSIKLLPWSKGYELATTGGLSNVLFSTTRTPAREQDFRWVGPITASRIVLLAPPRHHTLRLRRDADLYEHRFAVVKGDIGHTMLLESGVPEDQILAKENFFDAFEAIEEGHADLLAYDKHVAHWQIKQSGKDAGNYKDVFILQVAELYFAFNHSIDGSVAMKYQKAANKLLKNRDWLNSLYGKYR